MQRRTFLQGLAAAALGCGHPVFGETPSATPPRLLILIALKGGNDGLNTLIPFADPAYYALRPRLAIPRDRVLPLSEREGLHPSLESLMPIWNDRELAVIRGVGYPEPNLSHFRSSDIWETASSSDQVLTRGWLDRTFAQPGWPSGRSIDGVVIGREDNGCLRGGAGRVITLSDPKSFRRRARHLGAPIDAQVDVQVDTQPRQAPLQHILALQRAIQAAAERLQPAALETEFPANRFGRQARAACEVIANRERLGLAVVHLTLPGFDTHRGQSGKHARLLRQLADGLACLRAELKILNVWQDTLVLTYSEFGRRPRENANAGTDHGTASLQLALGGRVKGGLHGEAIGLAHLDSHGNPVATLDFRRLYATILERWWRLDSQAVLSKRLAPVNFLA
ncbi:MAG: DUF1501 domain-containing protein [Gammaproteobacteria bacterium]|jgi:uncharacterized protein (DUF1501 family)|nr:DUF1501 domain-containing protein [Gammaproteobacteria bacterium]